MFLYVESSNRPVIDFAEAALGSLNPASLVTTLVGDLYGAFDPAVDYWGPYSVYWDKNDLALSQNMGQLYIGALPIALTITVGLTRGALWAREMRAYTLSILFLVLYALGNYTPAFRLFYEVLPGVAFFRRPADASFLLGGLLAIAGGYVVHLWLNGELRRPGRAGRVIELAVIPLVLVVAIAIAAGEDKIAAGVETDVERGRLARARDVCARRADAPLRQGRHGRRRRARRADDGRSGRQQWA